MPPAMPSLGTGGRLEITPGLVQGSAGGQTAADGSARWIVRNVGEGPLRMRLRRTCDCTRTNLQPGMIYAVAPGAEQEVIDFYRRPADLWLETSDPEPAHRQINLRTDRVENGRVDRIAKVAKRPG